ncbi:signal peptidase I [Trueperella bialowiezensis]|uniref:Signal peptidase I n=1 Tax=Trueperella bialowiezensis TaxID=312285 RepID=A0A3S4Z4D9_9ACTO|nr:signal peptidase I [Trueperella bialowiezensis]VEI12691.1 Signal peptidase I T [Trueperella bialowiezensis]
MDGQDNYGQAMPPSYPPENPRAANPAVEPEPVEQEASAETNSSKFFSGFLEFGMVIAAALLLSVIIKTFFAQAFAIPSESMEDTLIPGDRILVNKLADGEGDLNRGDVVVFVDPGSWLDDVPEPERNALQEALINIGEAIGLVPQNVGDHLVKRIIGMPGDHVACCTDEGLLTVNGQPIRESYLKPGVSASHSTFDVTVPAGHVWVLGDNRPRSKDARFHHQATGFGFVPIANIEGRAWLTVYPFDRFGTIPSATHVFENVPDPAP